MKWKKRKKKHASKQAGPTHTVSHPKLEVTLQCSFLRGRQAMRHVILMIRGVFAFGTPRSPKKLALHQTRRGINTRRHDDVTM